MGEGAVCTDLMAVARRLLPPHRPELWALIARRPLRVCADVARCYAIIILGFVSLALVDRWWGPVLSFLLIGTQQYALAILQHDGKHGTLLRRLSANDQLTVWLLSAPIGLDIDFMGARASHLAHHQLLGSEPDPERYLYVAGDKATAGALFRYVSSYSTVPHAVRRPFQLSSGAHRPATGLRRLAARWWPTICLQTILFAGISALFPCGTTWCSGLHRSTHSSTSHGKSVPSASMPNQSCLTRLPIRVGWSRICPRGLSAYSLHR